jgi:hypothetical protein
MQGEDMLPGEKAKLVNYIDNLQAEKSSLSATYCIEVVFTKSPQKGVKCGAIAIFKMNDLDVDVASEQIAQKMKEAASEMTQTMYCDPEYFKETEGRWVPWAIERAMRLYDQLGSAEIVIKAPRLKIRHKLSSAQINSGRADMRSLFQVAFRVDELLDRNFSFDPWRNVNRRGVIGAEK